ncbi:MAG TPA: YeeE/YedE thiosulfate transporter family protein [Saprospiraceae bacterium]|nr:YeeE/YedE thiosulfate transporter family protein [Saprospiraceae bacterium]
MIDLLREPLHWSIAGIFIGLTVPVLLLIGNKRFGLSSGLKHICAICIPTKATYFQYDWKAQKWLFLFIFGIVCGAFIANILIPNLENLIIAEKTKDFLNANNISVGKELLPNTIFSFEKIFTLGGFIFMVVGGFLVGFGTRYAEGCTSGHSIYGLATLQWPSLVATICFMVGGVLSTHFLLPYLLKLM